MADLHRTPESKDDAFEELLVRLLDAVEASGPAALEALCAEHPEHAARLRAHAQRLSDFGMLAADAPQRVAGGLPERLGDYRPLRRIGAGGMGNVWVAEQVALKRRVALKLIRPEQLWFAGARERFAREVHAIGKLQHPGIVPVHDAGETAGLPWLAMELVDGASLDEVLAALGDREPASLTGADLEAAVQRIVAGRRDAESASPAASSTRPALFTGSWVSACLRIARAVADALVHAHERGVLHRDVKPSNVMLTPDGRALLLDFGLARSDDAVRMTQDQSQLGSPAYMSPEQVRGERDVDARTDVWSLGVLLCEMLMLRTPYADESAERTRALVLEAKAPPIRRRDPSVPRDAEIVCLAAMNGERDRRYATMRAFAVDLDNLLELRPVNARPPSPLVVTKRWVQRRPAAAIGAIAGVLVLVVAPTMFWLQQRAANTRIREALRTAEHHRDREAKAREQAQRDRDAAREVVQRWLLRVGAEELVDAPHMQSLRRDLLGAARTYHERFLVEAGDDPDLLEQATESAVQLATVRSELGETSTAGEAATRAVALAERLFAVRGHDRAALSLLAQAKARLAACEHAAGRLDAARAAIVSALPLQREALSIDPADTDARLETVSLLRLGALVANGLDLEDEAAARYEEIRDVFAIDDENPATTPSGLLQMAVAAAADEAYFALRRGNTDDARRAAERVLAWHASADANSLTSIERIAVARAFDVAARVHRATGDLEQAEAFARRCIEEAQAVLVDLPQHANALRVAAGGLNGLALVVGADPARRAEARGLLERSIATMRRLIALDTAVVEPRINLATSLANLGSMRMEADDLDGAGAAFAEAAELAQAGHEQLPTNAEAARTLHSTVWFAGQLAGRRHDHRAQVDAARQLAALQPDDARTQRIAGALIAEACNTISVDAALSARDRDSLLAERRGEAIALLRRAAELGCTDHAYLATHAHFAVLRDTPGFAEIVAQMAANGERRDAR
ncbi:MAG: serine/threonine protein kinase [Planctomycetes bacterium]|nr:serine/threonine protein kinase [Planctomycetota bacterium]